MKKTAVWALALVTLLCLSYLGAIHLSKVVYYADPGMADWYFWKERSSYKATPENPLVPIQIAGPKDEWGGAESKEIVISVPPMKPMEMKIEFLDSHEKKPPTLEIATGGKIIKTFQVAKGSGKNSSYWKEHGIRSKKKIKIPDELITEKGVDVSIKSVSGSWAAIGQITVRKPTPKWMEKTAIGGSLALLVLYIWYLSVNGLWKAHAVNFALSAASILVTLAVIEVFFRTVLPQQEFIPNVRIVYEAEEDVGFILKPNVKTRLGFDTNRHGMRDYDRYTVKKPPGVFRVMVLGDSFTFSHTRMEQAYPKYMERIFAGSKTPVEVLNAGVSGYGTDEEFHYFKKYGLKFEPDLVIVGFFVGNDITDNHTHPSNTAVGGVVVPIRVARTMTEEEITWEKRKKELLNSMHIYRFVWNRNYSDILGAFDIQNIDMRREMNYEEGSCIARGLQTAVHHDPESYEPDIKQGWRITHRIFDQFVQLTAEHGIKVAFVIIPNAIQLNTGETIKLRQELGDEYDFGQPQASFAKEAKKRGWNYFDALEPMKKLAGTTRLHYCRDPHFNEEGNRLLAITASEWLIEKGLMPEGTAFNKQ